MKKKFDRPNIEIIIIGSLDSIKMEDPLWNSIPSIDDPNELGEY